MRTSTTKATTAKEVVPSKSNVEEEVDGYTSDNESEKRVDVKLLNSVRKHLAIAIRDLLQHGLQSEVRSSDSVVPFIACFPQRSQNASASSSLHAWQLLLVYYRAKNGHLYNCSAAQKLSQSFNLDLVGVSNVSTKKV